MGRGGKSMQRISRQDICQIVRGGYTVGGRGGARERRVCVLGCMRNNHLHPTMSRAIDGYHKQLHLIVNCSTPRTRLTVPSRDALVNIPVLHHQL